ncbi:MAG TPA: alpha/beta fold hydrolase [Thermoanaerobaculia bacterium]|nr:alpha/beta fold hydrolase [Thermoanaerobaculia bacterium]
MTRFRLPLLAVFLAVFASAAFAQQDPTRSVIDRLERTEEGLGHQFDVLAKQIDDVAWFHRVGDVAVVEKVRIYGPPLWKEKNPSGIGAGNPFRFYAYLFTPKESFGGGKLPLLVFPHGGVHGDFNSYYTHIVRELIAQGYIIVAPEYRGSIGYGRDTYEAIDYGGREIEDTLAARDWAVNNHPRVDPDRVGLIGWSHGGLITMMSLFNYPEKYVAGFAGVPVSDLVQRMGYSTEGYRELFSADHSIGATARENLAEYKRRSPVWHAEKLTRPVRIHGNKSDEDVNVIEVEHLIQALTAAGKKFESQIYDLPGGHSFDRLDTPEAWKVRREIYAFLARHLDPPRKEIRIGLGPEGRAAP